MTTKSDYRVFVGAFPTGPVASEIQALRRAYDRRTAAITDPHVTLAGTYWRSGEATAENERELIERLEPALLRERPFALHLGGIFTFGSGVVYLGVEPSPALLQTRSALLKLIGPDKHGGRFVPHLTLAMRLNRSGTQRMVQELAESQWAVQRFSVEINRLHFMQRGSEDPAWRAIATMPLAGDADAQRR